MSIEVPAKFDFNTVTPVEVEFLIKHYLNMATHEVGKEGGRDFSAKAADLATAYVKYLESKVITKAEAV